MSEPIISVDDLGARPSTTAHIASAPSPAEYLKDVEVLGPHENGSGPRRKRHGLLRRRKRRQTED